MSGTKDGEPADILDAAAVQGSEDASSTASKPLVIPAATHSAGGDTATQGNTKPADVLDAAATQGSPEASTSKPASEPASAASAK